jgi:osmotically-inducible protein OsmY
MALAESWRLLFLTAKVKVKEKKENYMLLEQKKMDDEITRDVIDELTFDPSVKVIDLDVKTKDGKVTLGGMCETYTAKWATSEAAYRISGVVEVENNIVVNPVSYGIRKDGDIAASVATAIELDASIPADKVTVEVLDGNVTLYGTLDYYYQRKAAEDDAAMVGGVRSINNLIVVDFPASADDVNDRIKRAFARNAQLYDDDITVNVDEHKVTLSGSVETHAEKRMAEKVAWMAPGVNEVKNHIFVMEPFSK